MIIHRWQVGPTRQSQPSGKVLFLPGRTPHLFREGAVPSRKVCALGQFSLPTALMLTLLLASLLAWYTQRAFAQLDTVLVAVTKDTPPFTQQNESGELRGFDIDLLTLVAEQAGLHFVYTPAQMRYLVPAVATRFYDLGTGCLFVTPERQAWVNFSKPYFATGVVLVTLANNPTLKQLSDLSDQMTVGVTQSEISEHIAHEQTPAVVIASTTNQEALAQLDAGNLDAVLTGETDFFGYQLLHPDHKLKQVGGLITYNECAFAVPKDNPELLTQVNIALSQLQSEENGRYAALYHKWFGQRPLPEKPTASATGLPSPTPEPTPTASSQPTTLTSTLDNRTASFINPPGLVGIYYLTLQWPPTSQAANTISYQLITLAENGLWFLSETGVEGWSGGGAATDVVISQPLVVGNSQPGLWQINAQAQVEATLVVFAAPSANRSEIVRRDYQMVIAADGSVEGHFTLASYSADPVSPKLSETPIVSQTVEFHGQRLR